jgi:magnesium transporter
MATMRLLVDAGDQALPTEVSVTRLGELLADRQNSVWLDIGDPGPADVDLLRRVFRFHESSLEEITTAHERPQCDAFGGYTFVVIYAVDQTGSELLPRELNLFWGENYLVTIHQNAPAVLDVLKEARRRWEQHESREEYRVACLAYTLFDSLVDGHFAVQDRVRDRVESIEGAILAGAEGAATDLFRLRKELLRVPRLIAPTSHVLARVLRRERSIPDGLRPYFTDVQDRARHVLGELDTCRDLLGAALDVNVFHAFNRLGLIMKRLTAVTVIIMVPNFVASIYGMNFNHMVPSADSSYSFLAVVALLACMVVWGFIHSRLLGWL